MSFPETRPRRTRRTESLRRMVRETTLSPDNFMYPLFVAPGKGVRKEIASLPGQFHLSVDELAARGRAGGQAGDPVGAAVRAAREEGRGGQRGLAPRGRGAAGDPHAQEGRARSWRSPSTPASASTPATATAACCWTGKQGSAGRQRRHAGEPGPHGGVVRPGGRRHRRALGDDGRHDWLSARVPGRGRVRATSSCCPTRPNTPRPTTDRSGRRWIRRPSFGRSPRLPDGSGQRPRGHPRGRAGRRGGRGHGHGEARAALPGRHLRGPAASSTCPWRPTTSRASSRC